MTYTPERIARERAICDAATRGPWLVAHQSYPPNEKGVELWAKGPHEPFDRQTWNVETDWIHAQAKSRLYIAYLTTSPYFEGPERIVSMEQTDAEFIALARTAWPEALTVIAAARAYVDAVADPENSVDFVDARWREFRDALNGGAS